MKSRALACFMAIAVMLGMHDRAGAAEDKPAGYAAFKLVWQRNIFDPQRRAPEPERSRQPSTATPSAPRTPSFRLSGTMVSDERLLAFFGGSSSEFNKVITTGAKIGEFTVKKIDGMQVELERADQTYQLGVGQQLTMGDKIEIGAVSSASLGSAPAPPSSADSPRSGDGPSPPGTAPAASPSATTSSDSPPSNDKIDMARKMMERRRQEQMNK